MKPKAALAMGRDEKLMSYFDKLTDEEHEHLDETLGGAEPPCPPEHLPPKEAEAIAKNIFSAVANGDMVNFPAHYARFKIEPIRFAVENNLNFLQANILKYVMRYDAKNGLEDLRKAARCIDMLIEFVKGNEDWWQRRSTI